KAGRPAVDIYAATLVYPFQFEQVDRTGIHRIDRDGGLINRRSAERAVSFTGLVSPAGKRFHHQGLRTFAATFQEIDLPTACQRNPLDFVTGVGPCGQVVNRGVADPDDDGLSGPKLYTDATTARYRLAGRCPVGAGLG